MKKNVIENDFDSLVEQIKVSGKKASKWLSEQKIGDQKKIAKMLWSRGNLIKFVKKVIALKKKYNNEESITIKTRKIIDLIITTYHGKLATILRRYN